MKLCKYTLTLCLSLVVSCMLLPVNLSYAAEDNPFSDSSFTPGPAGSATIDRKVAEENAKQALATAKAKAEESRERAINFGVSSGVLNEAKKQAEGKKDAFAEDLKALLDGTQDAAKKDQMQKATLGYLQDYSAVVAAEKTLKRIKENDGTKGELYSVTMPPGPDGTGGGVVFFEKDENGNFVSVSGTSDGCTPLPVKLAEARRCLFCPLFTVLYNAANDMSTKSFGRDLSGPISSALIIGFAIFIAFKVMFLVSGFTKQDGPKFISELLTQTFKVFVAILILSNAGHIYDYVVSPMLEAGLEFGSAFLFSKGAANFAQCNDTMVGTTAIGDIAIADGVLSRDLYLKLHCFVWSVQVEISFPQSIGSSLMCIAVNAAAADFIVKNIIPDFGMLIQGLVIWVFSFLVSMAFAFYLIDATVRIGILGALMPFLVATWPFKMTSKYSGTGFTMLMNTFFVYTFVGIVISINIQLMGNALGGPGGFEKIQALINGDNVQELKDTLDTGAAGFLILIGCCLFGFKLTNQSSTLADSLAGGGGGEGIGAKIGGLAASAVKGGAKAAGGAAMGGAKAVGAATGATQKMSNMKDKAAKAVGQKIGMGRYGGAAGKASKGGGDKGGGDKGGGDKGGGDKGGADKGGADKGGDNANNNDKK